MLQKQLREIEESELQKSTYLDNNHSFKPVSTKDGSLWQSVKSLRRNSEDIQEFQSVYVALYGDKLKLFLDEQQITYGKNFSLSFKEVIGSVWSIIGSGSTPFHDLPEERSDRGEHGRTHLFSSDPGRLRQIQAKVLDLP